MVLAYNESLNGVETVSKKMIQLTGLQVL